MTRLAHAAWLVTLAGAGGFLSRNAAAQSVSPPIAEYQERARSSFQLQNASIFPITVVLEVRGFSITERGEVNDVPLDTSRIHVKLSEMSFRLPPRGTHTVFYEATSDSLPAWFNILSAMTGTRTESGLNVRILLPHVVYLNQKQPLRREEIAIHRLELDTAAKKARVQLENLGPRLGRVYQLTLSDGRGPNQPAGGFPLMPRSRRWAEVDWDRATPPSRLTARFARFTVDT
ncbi:MAG TPA: hypothetical protein VE399_09915, partial [Gemmatimonadales bacterium]|nr:hypothetical protein [Gemmatimonadales bacterium]